MKLFISTNSLEPSNTIVFRKEYVVAEKINTARLNESPFGSGKYLIEGTIDNGNGYMILLGTLSEQRAQELRRELFAWMARAAASAEPTALLLECHAGAWRQH